MAIKPIINNAQRKCMLDRAVVLSIAAAIMLPSMAFADATVESNLCNVLTTVNNLLNYGSVVIVTIAIIFSGYQIAFAHKRIGDVAPALIGGVLIGAAAQIAKMVIGGSGSSTQCAAQSLNTTMLIDHMHSAINFIQHYA